MKIKLVRGGAESDTLSGPYIFPVGIGGSSSVKAQNGQPLPWPESCWL